MKFSIALGALLVSQIANSTTGFSLDDFNLFATTTEPKKEEVDENDPASLHAHAISLAVEEKTEESLAYFEKALELSPGSTHFMNDLGVTLMRLGKLDEAERMFLKGLDIDPEHRDLLNNLDAVYGHIEHRDGNQGAQNEFKDFLDVEYRPGLYRDPSKPVVRKNKSGVKRRRRRARGDENDDAGEGGSAVPSYDDVVLEPDPEKAAQARSEAIEFAMADQLMEALPLFERAVKLAPNNAFYLSDLGVTYLRLNKLDKSKEVLEKADEMLPGEPSILDNLKALQQHLDHRDSLIREEEARRDAQGNNPVVHSKPFENAGIYDDDEEEEVGGEAGENEMRRLNTEL